MKFGPFALPSQFAPFCLALITAAGLLIGFQGWRSRLAPADMLPHIWSAKQLLAEGKIPDHGVLTSFAAYTPPGLAWFYVPGALLFSDSRMFDGIGRIILYVATITGLFLIGRLYLDPPSAAFAATLYAISELGLQAASVLYDRLALHAFYVWMMYWSIRWVRERKPRHLSIALLIYFAGAYTFPEIGPAVLIIPAFWFLYRPPASAVQLAAVALLAVMISAPYLIFESRRDFTDLKAMARRQRILPADYKRSWCDPSLTVFGDSENPGTVDRQSVKSRVHSIAERALLTSSFVPSFNGAARLPGVNVGFLWLTLGAIFTLACTGSAARTGQSRRWLTTLGIAMILLGVLGNEFLAKYISPDAMVEQGTVRMVRRLELSLLVMGIVLYYRRELSLYLTRLPRLDKFADHVRNASDMRPLVVSFVVPWITLFFLVANDRPDRFWWLWPAQVLLLGVFVTYFPLRLRISPFARYVIPAVILVALAANPRMIRRTQSWIESGWSGTDAEELTVVDYIVQDARQSGERMAPIGYANSDLPFLSQFNVIDPRYKVGAGFDFLFSFRHGFTNTDRCAEGFSPNDEYRVVETRPDPDDAAAFHVDLHDFDLVKEFGRYAVYKHRPSSLSRIHSHR